MKKQYRINAVQYHWDEIFEIGPLSTIPYLNFMNRDGTGLFISSALSSRRHPDEVRLASLELAGLRVATEVTRNIDPFAHLFEFMD